MFVINKQIQKISHFKGQTLKVSNEAYQFIGGLFLIYFVSWELLTKHISSFCFTTKHIDSKLNQYIL